jgi:hypothetical protein
MRRLDRYDAAGWVLIALVAALWIAHFVMPAGSPPVDLPR